MKKFTNILSTNNWGGRAFPFAFVVDHKMRIVEFGSSLPLIVPDVKLGMSMSKILVLERPKAPDEKFTTEFFREHDGQLLIFRINHCDTRIRAECFATDDYLAFNATPSMTQVDSLHELGLTFGHFPLTDSISDSVFVLAMQQQTLRETERMASELSTRNSELKQEVARRQEIETKLNLAKQELKKRNKTLSLEKELTEAQARTIFEHNSTPMYVFDHHGNVLDVNSAAKNAHGYSRSEFRALSVVDITAKLSKRVFNHYMGKLLDLPPSMVHTARSRLSRKNGELFPVEIRVQYAILPDGKRHIFASAEDITERLEHEETLKRRVAIASSDLEERNRMLESAYRSLEEQFKQRELIERERERLHEDLMIASREAGKADIATGVLHNVGNVMNSVNVTAGMLYDSISIKLQTRLGSAYDLLKKNSDCLPEFFANHGQGRYFVPFLGQLNEQAKQVLLDVEHLLKKVEHVNAVVNNQQSFATTVGLQSTVCITEVVESALQITTETFRLHDINVETEFFPVPPVVIDKQKLIQVLINLFRNAKHAIDDFPDSSRKILIRIQSPIKNQIEVSVCDSGIGIQQSHLDKIFRHGFSTRKDRGGHGFGLHHSYCALEEMGGKLQVSSPGEGKGATFTISLTVLNEGTVQPPLPVSGGVLPIPNQTIHQ